MTGGAGGGGGGGAVVVVGGTVVVAGGSVAVVGGIVVVGGRVVGAEAKLVVDSLIPTEAFSFAGSSDPPEPRALITTSSAQAIEIPTFHPASLRLVHSRTSPTGKQRNRPGPMAHQVWYHGTGALTCVTADGSAGAFVAQAGAALPRVALGLGDNKGGGAAFGCAVHPVAAVCCAESDGAIHTGAETGGPVGGPNGFPECAPVAALSDSAPLGFVSVCGKAGS